MFQNHDSPHRICDALPLSTRREGRKTEYSVFGVSELKYDIISFQLLISD